MAAKKQSERLRSTSPRIPRRSEKYRLSRYRTIWKQLVRRYGEEELEDVGNQFREVGLLKHLTED